MPRWRLAQLWPIVVLLAYGSSLGACTYASVSPPPPPSPPVVYNADISPQYPRRQAAPDRLVLRAGEPSTLRFGLGAPWPSSILPPVTPPDEILRSTEEVKLTVVLACSFCEAHQAFMNDLVYRPTERTSNVVAFPFVPARRETADRSAYDETLQLSVFNDDTGREYDRFVIDVTVDQDAQPQAPLETGPWAYPASATDVATAAPPDVVLYAAEDAAGRLTIKVSPIEPGLRARLVNSLADPNGRLRRFRSGVFGRDLEKITTSAFARASQISFQGEVGRLLRRGDGGAVVSRDSQDTSMLTTKESAAVSNVIAVPGRTLYRMLFVDGEPGLVDVIGAIEAAAEAAPPDRPLRMHIVTDRLSLPWQYLHPPGGVDARKFWGLRFSLSVYRVNSRAPAPLASGAAQGRKVVFARHGSAGDTTVPKALAQILQLQRLPVADLLVVDSRKAFLDRALGANRNEVAAIIAFLHASSGTMLQTTDSAVVAAQDASGPMLIFGDEDVVRSDTLLNLPNDLTVDELRKNPRYLGAGPLVILNACETGPSTIDTPFVTLEDAMFQLGARGVVVTEVSVWVSLGHEVATRLIAKLGQGQTASDALTAVRREIFDEKRNPLVLLYAYYGDTSAVLRR